MAKQRKIIIKNELPLCILGLVSSASVLKLIWEINQLLGIKLVRCLVNDLPDESISESEFPVYQYFNDVENLTFSLFQNKFETIFFFEEFKKIDIFLIIRGELQHMSLDEILRKLRSNEQVNSVIAIPVTSVKKKDKLDLF